MLPLFWACCLLANGGQVLAGAGLSATVSSSGDYTIAVGDTMFATSAPLVLRLGGGTFRVADGTLKLVNHTGGLPGSDRLGTYAEDRWRWSAGDTAFETAIRRYPEQHTAAPGTAEAADGGGAGLALLAFEQRWPDGAAHTTGSGAGRDTGIIVGFPALAIAAASDRGFVGFGGRQLEGCFAGNVGAGLHTIDTGGDGGGPVALFDTDGRSLAVSVASEFMSSAWGQIPPPATALPGPGPVLSAGTIDTYTSLPAGFSMSTIVVAGTGPTAAIKSAGVALLKLFNKNSTASQAADPTLASIGVSTDNGAYYYIHTEAGKDYEATMNDLAAYTRRLKIPYKYALLDSWWYEQGKGGGVKNWTAQPRIFPDGMESVQKSTGWTFQLHNRYWSPDNVYAKQNGGEYDFIVEDGLAIPTDQGLWDDLMHNATLNGMVTYEQDWLCTEIDGMNATKHNATLGRDWLTAMGRGASKAGVSIQYCMAYPRHVMQTVEIPAVTQVRASCDYHPGNTDGCRFPYCQWNVGTSSLLAWAVGLAPSKDNFWTVSEQPGNKYGNATREPYGEMGGVITTYSTGPVAIGDGVGYTDRELVLRSCTATTGMLLQPSRPATTIDACFHEEAFGGGVGPVAAKPRNYPVWSTHTEVGGCKWAHVIAILLAAPFDLTPSMLPLDTDPGAAYIQWTGWGPVSNVSVAGRFGPNSPISLPRCNASDFQLWHAAPVFSNGLAFLGEPAKWVPVATRRVLAVDAAGAVGGDAGAMITVTLAGDPGELVTLAFAKAATAAAALTVHAVNCTLDGDGNGVAVFSPARSLAHGLAGATLPGPRTGLPSDQDAVVLPRSS